MILFEVANPNDPRSVATQAERHEDGTPRIYRVKRNVYGNPQYVVSANVFPDPSTAHFLIGAEHPITGEPVSIDTEIMLKPLVFSTFGSPHQAVATAIERQREELKQEQEAKERSYPERQGKLTREEHYRSIAFHAIATLSVAAGHERVIQQSLLREHLGAYAESLLKKILGDTSTDAEHYIEARHAARAGLKAILKGVKS